MPGGPLLAIRHPRPRAGSRICLGRTDGPLAEPPETAAEAIMASLGPEQHVEQRVERIISSPLQRAFAVAQVLARWTGASLHADDRLTEQDFGTWTGRPWTSLPPAELASWTADKLHVGPGGGESGAAVLRRLRHAWSRLASGEETTLLLTHAAPIQCLRHIARGEPLDWEASLPYGGVVALR